MRMTSVKSQEHLQSQSQVFLCQFSWYTKVKRKDIFLSKVISRYLHKDSLVEFREMPRFISISNSKKVELWYPEDQFSLIVMDTFKSQDNERIKSLCLGNNCELIIVPSNSTNKFQPLDTTINQKAKKLVSS